MRSTSADDPTGAPRRRLLGAFAAASVLGLATSPLSAAANLPKAVPMNAVNTHRKLTKSELAIGPVAAATAVGDMPALSAALESALDAGLSVNELKEVLVQLYAYAGFPRALNALGNFMKVLQDRQQRGIRETEGARPGPMPAPQSMLEAGTANQTTLSGAPVTGPLFDFAPAIDQFLKAHLFGDIFARDNLPWTSRELATVAALAALDGVEPQLQAHVRISLNVGLTVEQLEQFADGLAACGALEASRRALAALAKRT